MAFVGGLLFCVPMVTQLVGICAALFALLRRRLPNERVALAWVGLILSIAALSAWVFFTLYAMNVSTTASFFAAAPRPARIDADGWERTGELIDEMERIHRAATAYYRDYKRWPDGVEPLAGRSLPRRFTMSPRITYRPVPPTETFSTDWALIVSEPVLYDTDGEPLKEPHRLVLRLNGKVEVLTEAEAKKLLAAQPTE